MKTLEIQQTENTSVDETKLIEQVNLNWNKFYTKEDLAKDIEQGFIFGPYGHNEHFQIDRIMQIINEVEFGKLQS